MSRDDKVREILEELWDKAYGSKFVRDFYGIDKALSQLNSLYKIDKIKVKISKKLYKAMWEKLNPNDFDSNNSYDKDLQQYLGWTQSPKS